MNDDSDRVHSSLDGHPRRGNTAGVQKRVDAGPKTKKRKPDARQRESARARAEAEAVTEVQRRIAESNRPYGLGKRATLSQHSLACPSSGTNESPAA
jgi:hypothetical protein